MPHSNERSCEIGQNAAALAALADAFIDLWLENIAAWSFSQTESPPVKDDAHEQA